MAVNKDGVYIAEGKDFQLISDYWIYKGEPLEVDITNFVNNKNLTSTGYMFSGWLAYEATAVKKVVLGENSVTDMSYMFRDSQATSLDLSSFDTSSVTDMRNMFYSSQATSLDLSSFDTSSVTDMRYMFYSSQAISLDLSSFDTSSVTDMNNMFRHSQATSLDLSSFDTSSVTNMSYMFYSSQATSLDLSSFDTSSVNSMNNMNNMFRHSQATTGYARTQTDADKFNSSSAKPAGLVFVVKPSFGRLNNLKIKSMSYKDSNGLIKQVQTLKYKDNLGNITKLK